jgi:Rps23 Pro-64 3,4-dihydroxylase Tpa1-like proline 4-hydroxylase
MIRQLDRERLRAQFLSAQPYRFVVIEDLLEPEAAQELARSYPTFETATKLGFSFSAVNEQKKVQVTDPARFPDPVQRLNAAIAAPSFLADLEYITGVPKLLADEKLEGGGMHITGSGGRLDVHVDFNYLEERKLHRRLNLLLYLNPTWDESWGGHIEVWDAGVKNCHHRFAPKLGRCLIFETSDISYHGVAPVKSPAGFERRSFACYYYTREAPPRWNGVSHSTIFRARPDERLRGYVLMPAEKIRNGVIQGLRRTKRQVKRWITGGAP